MAFSHVETLESRKLLAVTASFNAGAGVLTVLGDSGNNSIVVSRNAAGQLLVNNGAVVVQGGTATVANTSLIQLFGLGGNDNLRLDETNGALPSANIFGGAGNDTMTGGSGGDQIFGQAGNDQLLGKGGSDLLFGGSENDILTGGDGDDQVFGESGNDRMIWNPGDDTDLNEGGDGTDTVEVNGGNGDEDFTLVPNGTRVRFDRINPAPFSLDIGTTENLVLNANGGNDTFVGANGLATLISLTVDGGVGNDSITGGDGSDFLFGGDGNDLVTGGRGNDTAFLGAGDDTFVWNPGDGSDVVEGQTGTDTMLFNGANIAEQIDMSANGTRFRFTRDIASIVMDTNDVEHVTFNALGGADVVTVNNLAGTDVTQVNINLGVFGGGGDGAIDSVIVNGTSASDVISVVGAGTSYSVVGLPAVVNVTDSEPDDTLTIRAAAGNDSINASTLPAGIVLLTVDGGTGNDTFLGSASPDSFLGGDGADFFDGNGGDDLALLGAGNDTFKWDPGDGSDIVEGQADADTLIFNGSNISENFDISANGSRVRFFRDIGSITMDLDDVETVNLNALGGADGVVINDLSGTDLTKINVSLAASGGGGDAAADVVMVNGTAAADIITVSGSASAVAVKGLAAVVNITGPEGANDQLIINALGGPDNINATNLAAGALKLTINGGDDADVIIGSQGSDFINGGRGNDVAFLGAGDDTFVWNPGDGSDVVEGQTGTDTMLFNGANIAEQIELSANGGRLRFTRDIASIVMDTNDVEHVTFNALGGADQITVNNLAGTDVTEVDIDLGVAGGVGDGAVDSVIVNATAGDDVVFASGDANGVALVGLAAQVNITGHEPTDTLTVNALAGDDVIVGFGLGVGAIAFAANGGDGDDILIGGANSDTFTGGAGDDVLIGNGDIDLLDGGPGANVVIQ